MPRDWYAYVNSGRSRRRLRGGPQVPWLGGLDIAGRTNGRHRAHPQNIWKIHNIRIYIRGLQPLQHLRSPDHSSSLFLLISTALSWGPWQLTTFPRPPCFLHSLHLWYGLQVVSLRMIWLGHASLERIEKVSITIWSRNSTRHIPKINTNIDLRRNLYINVLSSIIHDSQNVETTQMPISWWTFVLGKARHRMVEVAASLQVCCWGWRSSIAMRGH